MLCHHERSHRYMEQAKDDQCQMVAYQCDSYESFLRGLCASCGVNGRRCILIDYVPEREQLSLNKINPDEQGLSLFVDTQHQEPFCSKF